MAATYFDIEGPVLSFHRTSVPVQFAEEHERLWCECDALFREGKYDGCIEWRHIRHKNHFVHFSIFESAEKLHHAIMEHRIGLISDISKDWDIESTCWKFFPAAGWLSYD